MKSNEARRKVSEKAKGNRGCDGQVETDPGLVKGKKKNMALLEKRGEKRKRWERREEDRKEAGFLILNCWQTQLQTRQIFSSLYSRIATLALKRVFTPAALHMPKWLCKFYSFGGDLPASRDCLQGLFRLEVDLLAIGPYATVLSAP